jgi:Mor family transcriptional regulator
MKENHIEDLTRIIGQEGLEALANAFGGQEIRIPTSISVTVTEYQRLQAVLGADKAQALVKEWGGDTLYVPMLREQRLASRNAAILAASRKGATGRELAQQFGLSQRAIRQILHKARQRSPTP